MPNPDTAEPWPALPLEAWRDTCATLHLWTQIVGKVRLAYAPWINHSWGITLRVSARGLSSGPIHDGGRAFQLELDFLDHCLLLQSSAGTVERVALRPRSVADFYREVIDRLHAIGHAPRLHTMPNEIADAIPLDRDEQHAAYDPDFAQRFWRVLLQSDRVLNVFRARFIGKSSPVHFFWGSFDLAVTRFSGRHAPPHPGGVPHLPDDIAREAYSHEVSSLGFWPGSGPIDYPAYYSYAYPEPDGFGVAPVQPAAAFYHPDLREFVLPYEAVRSAPDPDHALLAFAQSTYEAAANAANWNRAELEWTPLR